MPTANPSTQTSDTWRSRLLLRQRWLSFVFPLAVFVLVTSLEPTPGTAGGDALGLSIPYAWYGLIYAFKIGVTVATVLFVAPGYSYGNGTSSDQNDRCQSRSSWLLCLFVGGIGGLLWIGLCGLDLEHRVFQPALDSVGLGGLIGAGTRSAYNPFEQLADRPLLAYGFLGLRLFGLVLLVPLIEEFFLRGFLMRFVQSADWWELPFGRVNFTAVLVGTLVPMLMHPGELIATAVWFSLITWLMVRTRNIWVCIAAHATTNLVLGVWVLTSGDWHLL